MVVFVIPIVISAQYWYWVGSCRGVVYMVMWVDVVLVLLLEAGGGDGDEG